MFWFVSKLFWLLAQPVTLIGLIVLFGFVLTFRQRKGLGRVLIGFGLMLLFCVGFTNIGALLMQPLEARHARPAAFPEAAAGIIVLGGGTDGEVSAARQAYELRESGDRYVETLRLALAHPALPVLVSGGIGTLEGGGDSDAQSVIRLFEAFGLTGPQIRHESTSRNTYENAVDSAALLHPLPDRTYVLITSAYHMPRAVALFERAGFAIIPWPVDFHTTGTAGFGLSPFDPNANIAIAATALHEWIGLFAYWAAGRLDSPWP